MAKALRGEKRRDEAAAIAGLRRPGWDDWALNVAASEHADDVAAFSEAAAAVRDAQAAAIEGRGGPDVRAALRELRDQSAGLVRLAGEVLGRVGRAAPSGAELTARLAEVAAAETAIDQLRAGVLGSADTTGDDLFAGLQPAARPAKAPAAGSTRRRSVEAAPDLEPDRRAERAQRRQALAAAKRERVAAAKALTRAEAEAKSAQEVVRRAERSLETAERARSASADDLARADAELERARGAVDDD